MRRLIILIALMIIWTAPAWAQGGPVVLMGIDAEDVGHGPIETYVGVVNSILSKVTNKGSGILVIGCKQSTDAVTTFWTSIAGHPVLAPNTGVTCVNGESISTQLFVGFAMIAVVSDSLNVSGGLQQVELNALNARATDIAAFVNGGGGLLGFSQCALNNKYGYLGTIGAVTCSNPPQYQNVEATPEGVAIGIDWNTLDVCCWHDTYTAYPDFLKPLATGFDSSDLSLGVAAIGGAQVVITTGFDLTPAAETIPVGTPGTVTISVTQQIGDGPPTPLNGIGVAFDVSGANDSASGSCTTGSDGNLPGQCSFTYTGTNAGDDTITATATVLDGNFVTTASKTWTGPTITTLVGTGTAGFNGDGLLDFLPQLPGVLDGIPDRQINYPDGGIALAENGDVIFADTNNHRVRRISAADGTIETVAGTGVSGFNGDLDQNNQPRLATDAQLSGPTGVAIDHVTGNVFIVDTFNHRVVKVDSTGYITTVAGSPTSADAGNISEQEKLGTPVNAADARFNQPVRVAVFNMNTLIVADPGNGRIRRVNLQSQTVDTIAGSDFLGLSGDDGPATAARFGAPIGVAVDATGGILVADKLNNRIRRFTIGGPIVTIAGSGLVPVSLVGAGGFAGDGGFATAALLNSPVDVKVDDDGTIYIADQENNRIRKIDTTGTITTFAGGGTAEVGLGDGGSATAARLNRPGGLAVKTGRVVVVDTGNQRIREILPTGD